MTDDSELDEDINMDVKYNAAGLACINYLGAKQAAIGKELFAGSYCALLAPHYATRGGASKMPREERVPFLQKSSFALALWSIYSSS